ncbi:MAG TPA: porin [Terriglobales bacterium]|nr:porin [Terriglobales bacterium]
MRTRVAHVLFLFMLLGSFAAMGQGPDSIHAGGNDPDLPQPESKADALSGNEQISSQDSEAVKKKQFATPDLPPKWARVPSYHGKYFSTMLGFVGVYDYHAFSQDSDSITQVGRQRDQWDDRSSRFITTGTIGPESYKLHYYVAYAWNGFDAHQNKMKEWSFSDLNITAPVGKLGALTFGKTKEQFVYEIVGDATFLPSLERVLNPFFTSRDVGLTLSNSVLKKRMTYAASWANDWWVQKKDFDTVGNHFSTRVTGLASINADGSRYLHLGASARYAGADAGTIRLRGKPESNVTSNYVDTGYIPASNQKEFALEALWTHDRYSVLTEYVRSQVNATQIANPSFYGFYVTGSVFFTGEHRPYDRNVGFARRPIPRRRWGAVELTARYSRLDLDDKSIHGGLMNKGTLDLNWFLNRRVKVGVSGGFVNLDRAGVNGFTEILQTRMQYVF